MSRKWQRAKRWDDENLTGALRPAKWVAQSFSSIWLAVILLVLIALYGTVASIPVGLIALIPTWIVIALSVTVPVAAVGAGGVLISRRAFTGTGARFAASVLSVIVLGTITSWLWASFAWPRLAYDATTGEGLRFFADFAEANNAITIRRLPGVEMSELEFYSWWPLRLILVLFVINMVTATVRRIEFTFKNLGVLTVHTGIVVMALGSAYYQSLKKEGDTIVLAAQAEGVDGPLQSRFYDNTKTALWVRQERAGFGFGAAWEQRLLRGLPRYNDYGLHAADMTTGSVTLLDPLFRPITEADHSDERTLALDVSDGGGRVVDPDVRFRVVGYAPYADLFGRFGVTDTVPAGDEPQPFRTVDFVSRIPARGVTEPSEPDVILTFGVRPNDPANRVATNELVSFSYESGMTDQRFEDLAEPLPPGVPHGLIVRVPEADVRVVIPANPREEYEIGDTGWVVGVEEFSPQPPFPIITPGYEGASTSVAILHVTAPDGEHFDRYVYHHFPELNQDLDETPREDGRPSRRDADPAIDIVYLDATKLSVYFDERNDGTVRAIARGPNGRTRVERDLGAGDTFTDAVPLIDFALNERWPHSVSVEGPVPVPEIDRDKSLVGTHDEALIAVEVSVAGSDWREVVWLPFAKYMLGSIANNASRRVTLPDGREVVMAFSRVAHRFPGFQLRLEDFEMIAFDHRGAPRDFQSVVSVVPTGIPGQLEFDSYTHVTKLNAPLKAPYMWSEERGLAGNVFVQLFSGLNPGQYKLSQAGWDQQGWNQSQQLVDQGLLDKPRVAFTILGVGNNPGIHVIALGGVLVAIGTPWAFYIKPWLVRRERDRLAAEAKANARSKKTHADPLDTPGQLEPALSKGG